MNSRPELRNYRMKLIVWIIRQILKMLNQYAVDYPTFPINQRHSHLFAILAGCWAAKISRQTFWDTHGISGNVFVNPPAPSSSPYPGGFNPWISNVTEHISPHVTSERQTPNTALDSRSSQDRQPEFIRPSGGKIFKELWCRPTRTADLGTSLWQILYTNNICLLKDWGMYLFKIFLRKLCYGSKKWRWLNLWMISNLRVQTLSCWTRELLQHWIKSPKKPASRSVWRKWKHRFLRGRQIAHLIYEYFRVTGANDPVGNFADLFTVVLRNDDIQVFDSRWDEIVLSMTQVPYDELLESFYKLRIRESEKLKTVSELYNMEIHQKKARPDYHRLKTMVKRSIEQKPETEIMKGTPWSRIPGKNSVNKELWEIVGSGKLTGSVRKETIAVSDTILLSVQNRHSRILLQDLLRSRMWKMHREPEVLEAEAQVGKRLDCRARITSKELAPLRSAKNGILRSACSTSPKMDAGLGKSALKHTARLTNSLARSLKRM